MPYKKIICYPLGWGHLLYIPVLEELYKRKYFEKSVILTFLPKVIRTEKNYSHRSISFSYIDKDSIPSEKKPDLQYLEKEYGIPNLELIELLGYRDPDPRLTLADHFYFWENYFDREKPDAIVLSWPANFLSITMYLVARKRGILSILPTNARMFNRAILRNGKSLDALFDLWPGLKEKYDELKKTGLTEEQRRKQKESLSLITTTKPKPYIISSASGKPLKDRFIDSMLNMSLNKIKRTFRYRYNLNFNVAGEKTLPKEPFFFFPLHYEPEMALDLLAPYFRQQMPLIEYVNQSLPAGTKLLLKEHPNMIGHRKISYYKKLRKLRNVVLIHPRFTSYDIFTNKNCKGIITINSTVGYEALMFKKPVVAFGKAYYVVADDLVTNVTDLTILPEILMNIDQRVINEDKLLCFLQALDEETFEGFVVVPNKLRLWVIAPKNIIAIADEFEKKFPACR